MKHLFKKLFVFIIFIVFASNVTAQTGENFLYLKKYISAQPNLKLDSSNFLSIYHNQELHYLYPIYKSIKQEKILIDSIGMDSYQTELSTVAAMTGDYLTAFEIESKNVHPIKQDSLKANYKIPNLDAIEYKDAATYIINKSRNQKVVMINESHNKPQHRAFIASLLDELYALGYRYLAMETLNQFSNASLRKLNFLTGHFTCEPIGGEVVRKALRIGFELVAYEDSNYLHNINQREYKQAENIAQVLKKDVHAKILVLAGDKHIEEASTSDDRIPMAAYFKMITGINPLTIDQTRLTENSTNDFGAALYDYFTRKKTFTNPVVLIKNNEPLNLFENSFVDICLLHPPTQYKNGRPTWNTMNGTRKEVPIQPIYQKLFFVQVFYENEYQEKWIGKMIPADQTYITAIDGYYYVHLLKGRYKIVYRDIQYNILGSKPLVVE